MPEDFDYRRGPGQRRYLEPVQLDPGADLTITAIANCALCNQDGYRGGQVCDHVDHVATTVAGRAAVREALAAVQARLRPVDTEAADTADLVARQRAAAPPVSLDEGAHT